MAKTRKKLNRAKHNASVKAVRKRMQKEEKDRKKKQAREESSPVRSG